MEGSLDSLNDVLHDGDDVVVMVPNNYKCDIPTYQVNACCQNCTIELANKDNSMLVCDSSIEQAMVAWWPTDVGFGSCLSVSMSYTMYEDWVYISI